MARQRSHSIEFKRQVAQEFIAGESLYALSKRHDISRLRSEGASLLDHLVGVRGTGGYGISRGFPSLRLDARGLDHLGPLFDLVGNEFSEFGGCQ